MPLVEATATGTVRMTTN